MTDIKHKIIALVVAAGSGLRTQTDIPKQYLKVKGKSILDYTLKALCSSEQIDKILCVIAKDAADMYQQSVTENPKLLPVVFGGNTRQESVRAGLLALKDYNPDSVLIHDAARPNINTPLIACLLDSLVHYDGVCPALPVTDSLRRKDGTSVSRDNLFMVQTPQAFNFQKILMAHNHCHDNYQRDFTDDIAVANHYGLKTCFTEGNQKNYKITYPHDLEKFMSEQENTHAYTVPDIRIAMGYDVHCLIAGDGVIMGGIKIDCPYTLKGHSDADVLLHAITDALLGTIAAQDIGYHFNPNDSRWKGADSAVFLRHAHQLILDKGGVINFIDAIIICETPKINPHRDAIQKNIATILKLPLSRVSIKATTTEKLGFTGRSEGIAAQATATVIINN
jgi:2-C-methyl-D-erythritol 4-phosphate cytidylyltransferase / 2-C-methyl-D-erythritol 2,4-cyclodiphosphate synthase